ncbi:MAG: UDP-4-amino-4,6-dideoxy-N-acetyl-beta-L-altrosamine transaminase [Acidobacteriales bacterium]|nr:UDP-4-amino-4,6-dideoxy-N-acetyl-beta-L-altrosamine transaminase [Terriglobales bacterium]
MRVTTEKREALAIEGGPPARKTPLPYGHQSIDEADIQAVVETLRSDWLTTGPKVDEFEEAFAARVGAKYAVSFSSGTAALHGAAFAAGLTAGDEAITSPLSFAATANCVLYQQATPVFADVCADTLNLDPDACAGRITSRTRAVLPVDYGGHPADLDAYMQLADQHRLVVIEDACHALGSQYKGRRVGSIAHMTVFSFHPVKHVTTGEGGMVTTDDGRFAETLRRFRNHGISAEARQRQSSGQWFYEMVLLGFNYRLPDIAAALGISQLHKLEMNLARRKKIAERYEEALTGCGLRLPQVRDDVIPAWHLYPVRIDTSKLPVGRETIFRALRAENIGVNVHYIPIHLHPYYRDRFGFKGGEYPTTERAYEQLISIPMFHGMTDEDVEDVIGAVRKVTHHYLI